MRSPADMTIIEIDITNACDKRCSNCTRLCGHHQKPYFMDFETFKRAVDSLDGFTGIRSIMGGEPTLHPEFERFVKYLGSKFPKHENVFVAPQASFMEHNKRVEWENIHKLGKCSTAATSGLPGMFSNMGNSYKKHYEVITDNLMFQGLNDHLNPIYHQTGLVTRKELGIPDEEWIKLRDNCWIQKDWSASITPKGAFFCEIAGVLDMLLDGPGGWPIEPGWWKRKPEDFKDQLHWCELCGFACSTFSRDSAEEIDDVSPEWLERLKSVNSPKIRKGLYSIIDITNGEIKNGINTEKKLKHHYVENYEDRFNAVNSVLFTQDYTEAAASDDHFGIHLNQVLSGAEDWIVMRSENAVPSEDFRERIGKLVLNPGTLHYIDLSEGKVSSYGYRKNEAEPGFIALFSKNALSLRALGFDRIAQLRSVQELLAAWEPEKVIALDDTTEKNEAVRMGLHKDVRYAVWGAGDAGSYVTEIIQGIGGRVTMVCDRDKNRQGQNLCGMEILSPETLAERQGDFDVLIGASYKQYEEILQEATALGIEKSRIRPAWF